MGAVAVGLRFLTFAEEDHVACFCLGSVEAVARIRDAIDETLYILRAKHQTDCTILASDSKGRIWGILREELDHLCTSGMGKLALWLPLTTMNPPEPLGWSTRLTLHASRLL